MTDDYAGRVAELADRHGRMVFATAYRILGRPEDAEDVLQEVFLKLLASRNRRLSSEDVQEWGAYLRVMASRCAVDLLRRKSKWKAEDMELCEEMPAPADRNPRRIAIQHERARLLRQALSTLPKHHARVFALRYFEEFSYEEIARQAGLSIGSVGVLLHRACKRLRELLEPILGRGARREEKGENRTELAKENNHVAT